ncbi:MAG: carbonic anhydrase family protein [Chitinophagales bacterium]
MKSIQQSKLLAICLCVSIFFLLACNAGNKEENKKPDSTTSVNQPHMDSPLSDNEVKAEAPDAAIKSEQGYALPRHGADLAQSPIDIISDKADKAAKDQFLFTFHSDFKTAENLGHTIQIDFKEGSICRVNGKNYTPRQFHFHTPSEHLVDGVTFPLEMHIVNTLNDTADANKSSFLVIAVLFKMGAENKFIREFLNKIPHEEGEKNALQSGEVKLDDLFSQFVGKQIKSYYSYKGSFTTPPYTESVQWVVLKYVAQASEEQIMAIEKMEGNNARHVQAINNRKVYSQ